MASASVRALLRANPWVNAVARRAIRELSAFHSYGEANNVHTILGEFGWPNDKSDTPLWNLTARIILAHCRKIGLTVTLWDTGMMRAGYRLALWQPSSNFNQVSVRTAISRVAEEHLRKQNSPYGGVFLNTAAQNTVWGAPSDTSGSGNVTHYQNFSNVNVGVRFDGTNSGSATYAYDNLATLQFLYRMGVRVVTAGIRIERLARTPGGVFNAGEQAALVAFVANCATAGLKVILQPFNKASYYIDQGTYGVRNRIGVDAGYTNTHFLDFWTQISALFKNDSTVIAYALMNEPATSNMDSWENTCQLVVDLLRTTLSDNKFLLIPMLTWRVPADVGGAHPTWFISDPAIGADGRPMHAIEAHMYLDGSGEYTGSFQTMLNADRSGYRVLDHYVGDANPMPAGRVGEIGAEFGWLVSNMQTLGGRARAVASTGEHNRKVGSPWGEWRVEVAAWDTVTASRATWFHFRMCWNNFNDMWRFGLDVNTWKLQKRINGTFTDVLVNKTTSNVAVAAGQLVVIKLRGDTIRCIVGGTEVYQVTDSYLSRAAMCGAAVSNAPNTEFEWSGFRPYDYRV